MADVLIVEPSTAWVAQFRALASELRSALGPLALRVDHIGSTSVPGLAAKDIIDVQIAVAELSFEELEPRMTGIGLQTPRPRQLWEDHVPPWQTDVPDPADWRKLFFFRTHPAATAAYATLKRKLAALGLPIDTYADVKDPACDLIIAAAEDWAEQTGWRPGPSDA